MIVKEQRCYSIVIVVTLQSLAWSAIVNKKVIIGGMEILDAQC